MAIPFSVLCLATIDSCLPVERNIVRPVHAHVSRHERNRKHPPPGMRKSRNNRITNSNIGYGFIHVVFMYGFVSPCQLSRTGHTSHERSAPPALRYIEFSLK